MTQKQIRYPNIGSYRNLFRRSENEHNAKNDTIGGIILLIIGMILLFIGQSRVDLALSYVNNDYAYYSPSTINDVYSLGNWLRIFGIIFLISGLGGIIYGAVLMQKLTNVEVVESVSKRFCPRCGRNIPFDSVACPYCKHDFK